MNRKTRLEAKWANLLKECQSSLLTVKEFAYQHKISQGNLYVWAKRLGISLRSQSSIGMSFIELGSIQSTVRNTELYPVEMSVGGITIKTEMPLIQIVSFVKGLG